MQVARKIAESILSSTKIVKAEKKTGACSQFSEAYPIFYKNNKKWGIAMLFFAEKQGFRIKKCTVFSVYSEKKT